MLNRIPKWLTIVLILLVFGLVRMPIERSLRHGMDKAEMLLPIPGRTGFEQMSQSTLMGTLSGLRSLVASFLILEAFDHFSNQDWDANRKSLMMITYLEPTVETHWVSLVWNRGINATAWVEARSRLPEFEKELRFNEYALDAVELGKKGLLQIPDSVKLRMQISEVYKLKLVDWEGAARMYKEIIPLKGAPSYASRFYGYYLFNDGKDQEAYNHLIELYHQSENNHLPTLIKNLLDLEEKLNIPYPLRIGEKDPDALRAMGTRRKRKRAKNRRLPGGIVIP